MVVQSTASYDLRHADVGGVVRGGSCGESAGGCKVDCNFEILSPKNDRKAEANDEAESVAGSEEDCERLSKEFKVFQSLRG
jgi:hypothetical protein